ncbi:heme exporter protein CcmD [Endozoicomonas sp.]|uniref:heme exporter protein CcmD n=1 Tax=Endozoicomonas sp. TaxID=1892382 RepID=UPI0028878395|nr:heme exporter protein CcmD [Endozoicomonas sp.]
MSMYFDSWAGFLAMEGHGLYVWSAYVIAMMVIAYNLIAPLLAKRRVVAEVRRQERLIRSKVVVRDFKAITENSLERVEGLEPVHRAVERGVQ